MTKQQKAELVKKGLGVPVSVFAGDEHRELRKEMQKKGAAFDSATGKWVFSDYQTLLEFTKRVGYMVTGIAAQPSGQTKVDLKPTEKEDRTKLEAVAGPLPPVETVALPTDPVEVVDSVTVELETSPTLSKAEAEMELVGEGVDVEAAKAGKRVMRTIREGIVLTCRHGSGVRKVPKVGGVVQYETLPAYDSEGKRNDEEVLTERPDGVKVLDRTLTKRRTTIDTEEEDAAKVLAAELRGMIYAIAPDTAIGHCAPLDKEALLVSTLNMCRLKASEFNRGSKYWNVVVGYVPARVASSGDLIAQQFVYDLQLVFAELDRAVESMDAKAIRNKAKVLESRAKGLADKIPAMDLGLLNRAVEAAKTAGKVVSTKVDKLGQSVDETMREVKGELVRIGEARDLFLSYETMPEVSEGATAGRGNGAGVETVPLPQVGEEESVVDSGRSTGVATQLPLVGGEEG
jgi:hypothetical protein